MQASGGSRWPTARRCLHAFLITATGFLSQPKVPDIPGVDGLRGQGHPHRRLGRRAIRSRAAGSAVIGTGATAVQLIPELAKRVADLTVYQRTPIWVVPKLDVRFGERAKRLFARIPLTQRAIGGSPIRSTSS